MMPLLEAAAYSVILGLVLLLFYTQPSTLLSKGISKYSSGFLRNAMAKDSKSSSADKTPGSKAAIPEATATTRISVPLTGEALFQLEKRAIFSQVSQKDR